jgi:hypothetical protein
VWGNASEIRYLEFSFVEKLSVVCGELCREPGGCGGIEFFLEFRELAEGVKLNFFP